ncbi:hypothetical protein TOPH_02617 [Tolypocladium ophioglossoides CBS 100239]|uniref:Uncharacterized protein n=1 Tax=Tolypocladium ophioglossoides (strain CBS 100239) TaxID=1163406 RepID=A0A0L0NFP3_TOLOC|nr:hypothetical protein TOPH_02617 [Tolypocladium ophioglossoides CBS 100239]
MAVTRNAGQPPRPQNANTRRRNPSRTSRVPCSRARAPKRRFYDESTDSDGDSDSQSTDSSSYDADGGLGSDGGGANSALSRNGDASRQASSRRRSPRRSARRGIGRNSAIKNSQTKSARGTPLRQTAGANNRRNKRASRAKRRKLSPQADEQPTGVIPDWTDPRVSFDCWTDIFLYAARLSTTDGLSTGWLAHAATTCRALAEPALTALYRCPPVRTSLKAKRLASLLVRRPSDNFCNYRAKIEALHLNTHFVAHGALHALIYTLGRLKELIIYTPMDQPPYRDLDKNVRWHYCREIFSALEPAGAEKPLPTLLRSWEWSGRFIGGCIPTIESIAHVHQTPPFSQLTRLSLTNFQVPSLSNLLQQPNTEEGEMQAYHEDGVVIESIAQAISQLASLNHLVFESSTVMNDRLLPLLPKNLVHLELINCWEVKSEDLAKFLRTHGSNMRTLTLLHNQSLDLGFLTDLSETCPNLRELHMNLMYYRHHDFFNDADPMYEQALLPSQVPKWPSGLRVINIENIRNWSVEAAERCFYSLIDNAGNLTNLRHLSIKTMLDIPWQARATMRREWREKMEKVFLRPFRAPKACATLHPPPMEEQQPVTREDESHGPATPPSRRSGRLAAHSQDSDSPVSRTKSLRRHRGKSLYREPDTDEDAMETSESDDESDLADGDEPQRSGEQCKLTIQGLCTTVSIQVDNQKVREQQFGMEDFLDVDEDESEEEWDGDRDEDDAVVIF